MGAAADSFLDLDLDIACVLVVDDRRTDLICCFLDEIWFVLGVV